jgi:hypothetical protein
MEWWGKVGESLSPPEPFFFFYDLLFGILEKLTTS